jgi:hypothetical protein
LEDEGVSHVQEEPHKLAKYLASRKVIELPDPNVFHALFAILQSPDVAAWAVNTACAVIRTILGQLPSDGWRAVIGSGFDLTDLKVLAQ